LEHQGAGHAGVIVKVPLEEPVIGLDRAAGRQVAALPRATADFEAIDPIEEQHAAAGDPRRASVCLCGAPGRTEAIPRAAGSERGDLLGRERGALATKRGCVEAWVLDDR